MARNSSTLASASATLPRSYSISVASQRPALLLRLALRVLLHREIFVGDRVGDLGGELRIARTGNRSPITRDFSTWIDREPLVIVLEHPLLERHARRIARKPDERQRAAVMI